MTAPIDRIENVRAQVDDVERQMEACRVAGVQFSPSMTWRLLSACKSLLGPTMNAVKAEVIDTMRAALNRHPKACDQYDPDDVISCGWKSAVADLEWTLDQIEGDPHE